MISSKLKKKSSSQWNEKVKIEVVVEKNPDQLIGIKTSRVYSQIARTSRNPDKAEEKALLISALEDAYIKINVNGRIVKKDPPYVPMKANDIKLCFGKRVGRMLENAFIYLT